MCQHIWGGAFIVLNLMVKANGLLEKKNSCLAFLLEESTKALPRQDDSRNLVIRTSKELEKDFFS